jgi:hypothetical protein
MKTLKFGKIVTAMALTFIMGLVGAVDSGSNSVYIDQTNADLSTVSITQAGSGNTFGDPNNQVTPAFVVDGNNMELTVLQDGMNNSISGNFIGGDSTANIRQYGNTNTTTVDMGNLGTNAGTLGIDINGDNNTTTLNIGTTGQADNYVYQLNIGSTINNNGISTDNQSTSSHNTVVSNINSTNVETKIAIAGNRNNVTTTQSGASGHKIELNVIGGYNAVSITQDGVTNANTAIVNITGSGVSGNLNTTTIIQH